MSDLIRAEHLRVDGEILVMADGVRARQADGQSRVGAENMDPRVLEASRYARLARELEDRQEQILARACAEARAITEAARQQVDELLAVASARASREAEECRALARDEAERLRAQAQEEGRTAGEERARAQMAGAIQDLERSLKTIVEQARQTQEQILRTAEPEAIALAMTIARKVLEHELSDEGEALAKMITQALTRLRDKRDLRIRVSPGDLGRAAEVREQLLTMMDGINGLEIVGDPRIESGAVVETLMGTVDATVRGQLAEIEKAICDIVDGEGDLA